ncbi:MAG TPA: 3-dehydroquinate synthase [Herpetosiphonaceae bacterium]|nr:3-dehydroquinate synthase [Herpetosiphonaceae bacterium]
MRSLQQDFSVPYRYQVCFTTDLFNPANPVLRDLIGAGSPDQPARLAVFIDQGVLDHHPGLPAQIAAYAAHGPAMALARDPWIFPGGEAIKNDRGRVDEVYAAVNDYAIDRHSYVVAIGGGAVIDLVGYAAATAHRGVRLIRVPTTVLAQNDAAVGVKTSVNLFGKKNFLGTFTPPFAVINDSRFLATLSDRDWRSGSAEAVKVALLKDPQFFAFIEDRAADLNRRELEPMLHLIHRCAELHLRHIAGGDPFEFGSARPLDFGHWAAHKLEHLTGYELRHGEAVAIGMALDSAYARLAGHLDEADWRRIIGCLAALGFALDHPALDRPEALLRGLQEFREHLGGRLTITLLAGIGRPFEAHEMDEDTIRRAIALLREQSS